MLRCRTGMEPPSLTSRLLKIVPVILSLLLLSLIAGFSQIKTEGLAWQEAHYGPRLEAIARGEAPAPDRYRLLTNRAVVIACNIASGLKLPRPTGTTFVALRLLQNLLVFGIAYRYYRRLGIAPYPSLLGLSALAWGMTQSNYGSDLAFDAWTDLLFYLCAALALQEGRAWWFVGIAGLAALNRESSVLIPFMALACALYHGRRIDRSLAYAGGLALVVWVLVYLGIYLLLKPGTNGPADSMGSGYFTQNLLSGSAWAHSVGALGIIPVLAILSWRGWSPLLRPVFWSVVPLWLVVHVVYTPVDQSRVLLLPQILVFIPGMLCGLNLWRQHHGENRGGLLA